MSHLDLKILYSTTIKGYSDEDQHMGIETHGEGSLILCPLNKIIVDSFLGPVNSSTKDFW